MMKRFLMTIAAAAALASGAAAEEFRTLFRADAKSPNILAGFSVYNAPGYASTLARAEIDGVAAVKLLVTETEDPPKWYTKIQLRLALNTRISAGSEYRLRFRCRADRPGRFLFRCQESATPWPVITEHRNGNVLATPEWQQVEYTFTATGSPAVPVWFPNFECGLLGKGNALYLTDIVIEALDAETSTVVAAPDPRKMQLYCAAGFKAKLRADSFEGKPVGAVTVTEVPASVANPSQVQFRHPMTTRVVKGGEYRFSFYHRCDREATVQVMLQRGQAPWSMISPGSFKQFKSTPEWSRCEMTFTVAEDYGKLMFLPNFGVALIGKGGTFFVREPKLEKLD